MLSGLTYSPEKSVKRIKMSDMKCPFCQQELEIWHANGVRMRACPDLTCKGYYMSATKDTWQELIRTRKALNIAVDALNVISQITKQIDVRVTANIAIETVKALEQKGE